MDTGGQERSDPGFGPVLEEFDESDLLSEIIEGDDVAETAARVGAERGTTYVLIGEPRSAKGLRRFGVSLPEKLLQHMPGVDIRIVADRTKHVEREESES